MVTIRLARPGSKKNPFYHITVADQTTKRDGRFVERLGFYNPVAKGAAEGLRLDLERFDYWMGVGANLRISSKNWLSRPELSLRQSAPDIRVGEQPTVLPAAT